jgi:hypothetical protein
VNTIIIQISNNGVVFVGADVYHIKCNYKMDEHLNADTKATNITATLVKKLWQPAYTTLYTGNTPYNHIKRTETYVITG